MKSKQEIKKQLKRGLDQLSAGVSQSPPAMTDHLPLSREEVETIFGGASGRNSGRGYARPVSFRYRAAAVFAVMVLLIGAAFMAVRPGTDTVLLIRVNPSVEIRLRGDRVRTIEAKNADAEPIIAGINAGEGLDAVIDTILRRIQAGGYFEGTRNTIAVSVSGKDSGRVRVQVEQQMKKSLQAMGVSVPVVFDDLPADASAPAAVSEPERSESGGSEESAGTVSTLSAVMETPAEKQESSPENAAAPDRPAGDVSSEDPSDPRKTGNAAPVSPESEAEQGTDEDRKSTLLNSSHSV